MRGVPALGEPGLHIPAVRCEKYRKQRSLFANATSRGADPESKLKIVLILHRGLILTVPLVAITTENDAMGTRIISSNSIVNNT